MNYKSTLLMVVLLAISACAGDPRHNPNIPGGSEGKDGVSKINCVANNGLLVSRKGGGWWCKINGELKPLSEFN